MKKTTDQAYEILDDTVTNNNQWPRDRLTPGKTMGKTMERLGNEVLSNLVNHVAQLTKHLQRQQGTINVVQTSQWELCEFCGGQHSSAECHSG